MTARPKQWAEWAAKISDDPRRDLMALSEDLLVTTAGYLAIDVEDQQQNAPALVLNGDDPRDAALIKQLRAGLGGPLGMVFEPRADRPGDLIVLASGAPMMKMVKALQRVLVERWVSLRSDLG